MSPAVGSAPLARHATRARRLKARARTWHGGATGSGPTKRGDGRAGWSGSSTRSSRDADVRRWVRPVAVPSPAAGHFAATAMRLEQDGRAMDVTVDVEAVDAGIHAWPLPRPPRRPSVACSTARSVRSTWPVPSKTRSRKTFRSWRSAVSPIPASARASCSRRATSRDMRMSAASIHPMRVRSPSRAASTLRRWTCASATATGVRSSCAALPAKARSPSMARPRRIISPFSVAVIARSSLGCPPASIGSSRPSPRAAISPRRASRGRSAARVIQPISR